MCVAAQTKEQEDKRVAKELAHIRNTFKTDKKIDGYDRKKYVAKLLYIHLLGYEVDFGHMEALHLLSSPNYQEKQIVSVAHTIVCVSLRARRVHGAALCLCVRRTLVEPPCSSRRCEKNSFFVGTV